jgi:hypothetical protein
VICGALWYAVGLEAASRTSANYSVIVETADSGGGQSTSGSYSSTCSLGGIGGVVSVGAPRETLRVGYAGELFEVKSLTATATPAMVAEGSTTQLAGVATLDDGTTAGLGGADIQWKLVSGTLSSINSSGLATAGLVYTNEVAAIWAGYLGGSNTISLVVVDSDQDNYGSYANDGLPDWWQIAHFGFSNTNAAPGADPDHDGQNNLMEFIAGTDPTSASSVFTLLITNVAGQITHKNLSFGPCLPGRDYTVEFCTNLASGAFAVLTGGAETDNGSERTVTDLNANQLQKFYRVKIGLSDPLLLSPTRQAGGFSFTVQTAAGFNYLVEYKDNLRDTAWLPLQWVLGDGQVHTVMDNTASGPTRFYRVRR